MKDRLDELQQHANAQYMLRHILNGESMPVRPVEPARREQLAGPRALMTGIFLAVIVGIILFSLFWR